MKITINNPIDMHIHLRNGEILNSVVKYTSEIFSACLAMPNLTQPIINTTLALNYKKEILNASKSNINNFLPILSIYITSSLNKEELRKAKNAGIKILKLYPKGATTGSENGVNNILDDETLKVFNIAQELGFILCIHAESDGFSMDREFKFMNIIENIAKDFPKLKIIVEHLSDRRSISVLEKYENVFATLTLHHITMTLDDVIGNKLNPNHFCKPILKTKKDKEALLELALNANRKVSFGSDSAPHLEKNKLSNEAMPGIFSAPILLQKLCEIFEYHNKLDNLQKFVSDNAIKIYDLKDIPKKTITLEKREFKVKDSIYVNKEEKIIPLFANQTISWNIVDR